MGTKTERYSILVEQKKDNLSSWLVGDIIGTSTRTYPQDQQSNE